MADSRDERRTPKRTGASRRPSYRQALGARGEALAVAYLRQHGYAICETNWRCPVGEMDIVAEDDDCLAFVEVRTRRGSAFGTPEESITPAKQAKLIEVARTYLQAHEGDQQLPGDWRIDVVAVEIDGRGEVKRIELIRNAVTGW